MAFENLVLDVGLGESCCDVMTYVLLRGFGCWFRCVLLQCYDDISQHNRRVDGFHLTNTY